MLSILVVDDDELTRALLSEFFESLGHRVRTAATASDGRRAVAEHSPDVALVDRRLPDADGIRLLEALRADDPEVAIIILTGHGDIPTAVHAMREGAADFLEKPIDLEAIQASVERAAAVGRMRRELAHLRARDAGSEHGDLRPWAAPSLERMIELAARNDDAPVLIVGETGTGKGFVARRIHEASPRRASPFVEINCASLSATFLESELFGHERGAFTDARQAKRGLFEVADRGSVFLDEVGELSPDVQPKLLKAIEERTYRRLGGTTELRVDARLVAATNRPLAEATASGRFRADLFYRLQVLTIALPPLRERPQDIPGLASTLLPRGAHLAPAGARTLQDYHWPGNIRELRNALWRAAILAEGHEIGPEHLALPTTTAAASSSSPVPTLADAERAAIEAALRHTGGNRVRAAALLGIARSTLSEKLKRLGSVDALSDIRPSDMRD